MTTTEVVSKPVDADCADAIALAKLCGLAINSATEARHIHEMPLFLPYVFMRPDPRYPTVMFKDWMQLRHYVYGDHKDNRVFAMGYNPDANLLAWFVVRT